MGEYDKGAARPTCKSGFGCVTRPKSKGSSL
jgi:hypothetical protein